MGRENVSRPGNLQAAPQRPHRPAAASPLEQCEGGGASFPTRSLLLFKRVNPIPGILIGTVAGAGTLRLLPDRAAIHFHQARGSLMCPLIDLVCVRGPARRPGTVAGAPGFPRTGEKRMKKNIQTRSLRAEPPRESPAAGGKVRLIPFYNEETTCNAETG